MHAPALARLMRVAGEIGREAVDSLWTRYEERWGAEPALLLREGHQVLTAASRTGVLSPVVVQDRARQLECLVQESLAGGEAPSDLTTLADTMVDLGLVEDAKRLLRQAVASTLSVYYRKDYQLSSWIALLGPKLDGQEGAALARWLAGAIAEVRESTEGGPAADAARELLLGDGAHRPGHSWNLGRWLEDSGLVDWDDRAMTLLEARLGDAGEQLWWNVLVNQIAPISPAPDVGLLKAAAHGNLSRDTLRRHLAELLSRVDVESPPRTRKRWREAIADCAAEAAIPLSELRLPDDLHPDQRPPRSRSRGTDEEARDAFLATHRTVDSLLQAAEDADLTEWRSEWEEAVSLKLNEMSLPDVERAAAIFATGSSRLGVRVLLARRAVALGAPDVAARLANDVLAAAEARSWLRNWDRGSIMGAFRVLDAINPSSARDRAYRRFAADAGSDVYLLSEVGRELAEFRDVFGIDDYEALGAEVEALSARSPASTQGPTGRRDSGGAR